MALDRLQSSTLTPAFTDLLTDLGDLVQKEMQLAKAEVTEKITSRLQASIWMAGAGLVALVAVLLVVEAAAFAIASVGLALHWSCLLVAAVLAASAIAIFFYGRSLAEDDLMPKRSARQINQDIRTAKEQLT
jgi:putative superfamily III holin-X